MIDRNSKNRARAPIWPATMLLLALYAGNVAAGTNPYLRSGAFSQGDEPDTAESPPGGSEGISFTSVPMDTSLNCNSVILQGTRRYQGTAFLLPRAVVSQNKAGETLFEFSRLPNGKHLLRFAVYFPRTDEELKLRMQNSPLLLQGCDLDAVIKSLNQRATNASDKINTVARAPISAVEVRIDGLEQAYTIGKVAGSVLDYQGRDHIVEFQIDNEQTLEGLMARLESPIGLGIHMAMKFAARSGDGSLSAKIDLQELANLLQAGGGADIYIARADLEALLAKNVSKLNIDIESEGGNDETYKGIVSELMTMITDSLRESGDSSIDDWLRDRESANADDGGGVGRKKIKLSAILNIMKTKKSFDIHYQNSGPSAQQTYSTSVAFHGEITDPDVRQLRVSGEHARIIADRLSAGAQLTLAAVSVESATGVQEIAQSRAAFMSLPIEVNFSKIGPRRFKLAELLAKNAYWSGTWDEFGAKLELSVKQELGQMTISRASTAEAGAQTITLQLTNDREPTVIAQVHPTEGSSETSPILIPKP